MEADVWLAEPAEHTVTPRVGGSFNPCLNVALEMVCAAESNVAQHVARPSGTAVWQAEVPSENSSKSRSIDFRVIDLHVNSVVCVCQPMVHNRKVKENAL